jgi:hypothetical protein
MTMNVFGWAKVAVVGAVVVGGLLLDGGSLSQGQLTASTAQARVGRPATPVSYAGVARRTTRRAVAVGAAATTACVQRVDAYGRVVTVCN